MQCDMCGTNKEPFYNAKIEGTNMRVCGNCSAYAQEKKIIRNQPSRAEQKRQKRTEETKEQEETKTIEIIEMVVEDYAQKIKKAREKQGLKQAELAKKIAEKESLLHTLESGKQKPSMPLARKLERTLHISLIIKHEEKHQLNDNKKRSSNGALTIGDLLKK